MEQSEVKLLKYIEKKYKIEVKKEFYEVVLMNLTKISLIVKADEENDKLLEAALGVKGVDAELTKSKIYNISYDRDDKVIQKMIIEHAKKNLTGLLTKFNKIPECTLDSVLNHLENINSTLDVALIIID